MAFRALAFDLDGTLLDGNERVSPQNLAALAKARAAGYALFVASARWRQIAQRVADDIGSLSPVVACSGAEVWSEREGRDLHDVRLPEDFTAALYAICDANRCVATVTVEDVALLKLDGEPDMSLMPPAMRWVPQLTGQALNPRIAVIQGTAVNALLRAELMPQWSDRVRFVESISPQHKSMLTLTATGADKGIALGVACAHMGIDPQDVVAFGDAENDLEMFRIAGASVAMGQAADFVKEHATFVSARYDEGGVAVGVERLLELGRV